MVLRRRPPRPGHRRPPSRSPDVLTVWDERMREIGRGSGTSAPLNQEDLLATLGTFTTVVFDVLDRFGVTYDDVDPGGLLLPLERHRLAPRHRRRGGGPGSAAAVAALPTGSRTTASFRSASTSSTPSTSIWPTKLQQPTHQGRRMTKALMQELAYPLPDRLQGAPAFIARYLLSEKHADDLGIERGGYTELLLNSSGLLLTLVPARPTERGQPPRHRADLEAGLGVRGAGVHQPGSLERAGPQDRSAGGQQVGDRTSAQASRSAADLTSSVRSGS